MKDFMVVPLSLRKEKDKKLIEWINKLPKRNRSSIIRSVLKKHLKEGVKYLTIIMFTTTKSAWANTVDVTPINDLSNLVFNTIVKIAIGISLPLLGITGLKVILGCSQPEQRSKAKEMGLYIVIGLLFLAASP